ncbi:MAG: hypothetical protein IJP70_01730 [Bacteroidales bacterium]|nr:hypothetical protein [Bacteroidales bacterium]
MKTENLKNWGAFIAFLVLAAISCWATEHSFHLLIKWMPEPFVWGLTIAFFIVASYGTKMIVDALNKDLWMDHRRRTFWIGIILVLIFWLLMSMPTNTHTFFYNHNIGNKVQEDLTTTKTYLEQIKSRQNVDSAYFSIHDEVYNKFKLVQAEFNATGGTGNRGNGKYVRDLLGDINPILEKEIPGSAIKFNDEKWAWNNTDQSILTGYVNQMNKSLKAIKDQNYTVSRTAATEASEDIRKIDLMTDTIKTMVETGSIHEDVITQAEGVILSGYTCIKNNQKFVKFKNSKDKELYTAENLETNTKRMLSVIDVWMDFFRGKYPISFLFYVLLSVLVDVAAFIFFDFAFKKREN